MYILHFIYNVIFYSLCMKFVIRNNVLCFSIDVCLLSQIA